MECPGRAKRQDVGNGGDENRHNSSRSSSGNVGKSKLRICSNGEYGHPPKVPRVIRVKDGRILDSVASQTLSAMMWMYWPFGAVNFWQACNVSAPLFVSNILREFDHRYKELRDGRSQFQESRNKGDIDLRIEASRLVTWNELLAETMEHTLKNYSTSHTFNTTPVTPEQLRIVVQEVLNGYTADDLVSILRYVGQTEIEAVAMWVKLFDDSVASITGEQISKYYYYEN